jgi:hypothetical protein
MPTQVHLIAGSEGDVRHTGESSARVQTRYRR